MKQLLNHFIQSRFYFFAIIGGIGFFIDSGIFTILHFSFGYAASRVISIFTAMTFTWLANRTVTFKNLRHSMPEISDGKENNYFFKGSLDPVLKHRDCASPPVQAFNKPTYDEWIKYFSINSFGALINFCMFLFLVHTNNFLKNHYFIPLIIATSMSMWFNFGFSRRLFY